MLVQIKPFLNCSFEKQSKNNYLSSLLITVGKLQKCMYMLFETMGTLSVKIEKFNTSIVYITIKAHTYDEKRLVLHAGNKCYHVTEIQVKCSVNIKIENPYSGF